MTPDTDYLPQYTLDRLAEQVCLRLDHFGHFDPATMWSLPIRGCRIIELQPLKTSSLVLMTKKKCQFVSDSNVKEYHQLLTLVYVLLYYRNHRRNRIIDDVVLPKLVRNMGMYGKDGVLKEQIQKEIDRLIEEDRMVAEAMGDDMGEVDGGDLSDLALGGPADDTDADADAAASDAGSDADDADVTDRGMHDKVRCELFIRLLELAGLDLANTGNKKRLAHLWHELTGKSSEVMRRFCTYRKYVNNHTRDDLERLNKLLGELGIDMRL